MTCAHSKGAGATCKNSSHLLQARIRSRSPELASFMACRALCRGRSHLEPVQRLLPSAMLESSFALLQAHDQDAERLYRKLKARQERVGIEQPSMEVRFEDLKVEAKVYVGNRAVPTVINSYRNFVEVSSRDAAFIAAAGDFLGAREVP